MANFDGSAASELFEQIEAVAGEKLVSRPDLGSRNCEFLGFEPEAAVRVLERLNSTTDPH